MRFSARGHEATKHLMFTAVVVIDGEAVVMVAGF